MSDATPDDIFPTPTGTPVMTKISNHKFAAFITFFHVIYLLFKIYVAYSDWFERYDLHLITKIKSVVAVIVYGFYFSMVWQRRFQWNEGIAFRIGFIILNAFAFYAIDMILNLIFSVQNQNRIKEMTS
tara:strand:+ start:125 stop:508 length:384 start_codon:yes stop_codon:yes gene_type:complete